MPDWSDKLNSPKWSEQLPAIQRMNRSIREDAEEESLMQRVEKWAGKKMGRKGDIELPRSGKRDPRLQRAAILAQMKG